MLVKDARATLAVGPAQVCEQDRRVRTAVRALDSLRMPVAAPFKAAAEPGIDDRARAAGGRAASAGQRSASDMPAGGAMTSSSLGAVPERRQRAKLPPESNIRSAGGRHAKRSRRVAGHRRQDFGAKSRREARAAQPRPAPLPLPHVARVRRRAAGGTALDSRRTAGRGRARSWWRRRLRPTSLPSVRMPPARSRGRCARSSSCPAQSRSRSCRRSIASAPDSC